MRTAVEQKQRAGFAKAWHRDATSKVARKKAARLLKASAKAEARYVHDVVRVIRGVHAGFLGSIGEKGAHADARPVPRPFPHGMKKRLFEYVRKEVGPAFDRMGREVDRDNREGLALLGIQPAYVPGLAGTIAHAREDNVRLVQRAAGDYADQVQKILTDPALLGLRHEELRDLLVKRGNVSVSRATLIARDQTLKTNAAITKARQQAAGVTRYTWSTSQDERVRPMHEELEDEDFDFDDPPITNEAGDTNNPGEDFQCRCVPLPILPDFEEEDEPEEEEPPEEEPEEYDVPEPPEDVPELPEEEEEPEEVPEPPEPPEEELEVPEPPEVPAPFEVPEAPEAPELLVPEAPEPPPELIPNVPTPPGEPPPRGLEAGDHFTAATASRGADFSVAEVIGKALHEGLRAWLEEPANRPTLRVLAKQIPGQGRGVEGIYRTWTSEVTVAANVEGPRAHELAKEWHDTWRVADRGRSVKNARGFSSGVFEKTQLEKVQDTFLHEFGHHVHLGPHARIEEIDGLVRAAYTRTGLDDPTLRRSVVVEKTKRSPAISRYAATNPAEYFAESFNAYMTEPAALEAEDLNGYTMVKQVLKRLKIER